MAPNTRAATKPKRAIRPSIRTSQLVAVKKAGRQPPKKAGKKVVVKSVPAPSPRPSLNRRAGQVAKIAAPPVAAPRRYQLSLVLEDAGDGELKVHSAECKKVDGMPAVPTATQPSGRPTRAAARTERPAIARTATTSTAAPKLALNTGMQLLLKVAAPPKGRRVRFTPSTKAQDGPPAAGTSRVLSLPAPKLQKGTGGRGKPMK